MTQNILCNFDLPGVPDSHRPDNYRPDNYRPDNYRPDNYRDGAINMRPLRGRVIVLLPACRQADLTAGRRALPTERRSGMFKR